MRREEAAEIAFLSSKTEGCDVDIGELQIHASKSLRAKSVEKLVRRILLELTCARISASSMLLLPIIRIS